MNEYVVKAIRSLGFHENMVKELTMGPDLYQAELFAYDPNGRIFVNPVTHEPVTFFVEGSWRVPAVADPEETS